MKKKTLIKVLSSVLAFIFGMTPLTGLAMTLVGSDSITDTNWVELKGTTETLLDGKYKVQINYAATCRVHNLVYEKSDQYILSSDPGCVTKEGFKEQILSVSQTDKKTLSGRYDEFINHCNLSGDKEGIYYAARTFPSENDLLYNYTFCFKADNGGFDYITFNIHYNAGNSREYDDGVLGVYYTSNYFIIPVSPYLYTAAWFEGGIGGINDALQSKEAKENTLNKTNLKDIRPNTIVDIVASLLNTEKIREDFLHAKTDFDYYVIDSMLSLYDNKGNEVTGDLNANSDYTLYFQPAGFTQSLAFASANNVSPASYLNFIGLEEYMNSVESEDSRNTLKDNLRKKIGEVNITNPAFIDFGDSNSVGNKDETKSNEDPAVQIGKLLVKALCTAANDTTLSPDNIDDVYGAYLDKLKTYYGGEDKASKSLWYRMVKSIRDAFVDSWKKQDFKSKYKEVIDGTNFEDPFHAMSAVIYRWFQSETEADKSYDYMTVNYKGQQIPLQKMNSREKGVGGTSVQDLWNDLTHYQQTILNKVVSERMNQLSKHGISVLKPNFMSFEFGYSYAEGVSSRFAEVNSGIEKEIQDSLRSVDEGLMDTQNILNVIRNCGDLGKYIIGLILYDKGSETGGSYNVYNIYNPFMDSLIMGDDYIYDNTNVSYFPVSVPSKIPLFEDSNKDAITDFYSVLFSSPEYTNKFAMFLYNVSLGFHVAAFSERGTDDKITIEQVEHYFETGDTDSSKPPGLAGLDSGLGSIPKETLIDENKFGKGTMSATTRNMIRSIIELADLCKFLKIAKGDENSFTWESGLWTETIDEYLGLYQKYQAQFEAIRLNLNFFKVSDTGEAAVDEPLGLFFNMNKQVMSDQWNEGFAASALYVPLHTNLYNIESVQDYMDKEYLQDFYYKYAFYRKALYINTNSSEIVNKFVSGKSSTGRKVATLSDLLNYRRDIVLYIDDNFYNAKDIASVSNKLDYTAIRNGSKVEEGDADKNLIEKAADNIGDAFSNALQLSPEQVLKTGDNKYYSETLARNVTKLGQKTDKANIAENINNNYILSEDRILGSKSTETESTNTESVQSIFDEYEYSVEVPYGIVSAVYRSPDLYNKMLECAAVNMDIVFESSSAIGNTPGTSERHWRSIYNYYMLANLQEQMLNDSASSLDVNAPIFCDIFGNILTESGLVIIPAAANATLCGDSYTPFTIGFNEYYNKGNRIPIGLYRDEVYTWLTGMKYDSADWSASDASYGTTAKKEKGGGYFVIDPSGYLALRTTQLSGRAGAAVIQWDMINKNSTVVKDLFYDDAYYSKTKGMYSTRMVNLVVETLRGAPIEFIDYTYEGLSSARQISPVGVLMASKLEEMSDSIIVGINGSVTNGNTAFTMPNLAFMEGVEYIVLYVFKIVFAVLLFAFAINLYLDATSRSLGIKSVGKFVLTCILVLVSLTIIPKLISYSYDRANRDLLMEETGKIMMLNYVKDFDGAEIGVQEIRTPETSTKLYIKLDTINMPWWSIIYNALFNNSMKTVSDMYDDALKENPMALEENVVRKADGLYMDTNDLLNSTTIVYYPKQHVLMNLNYTTNVESQKTKPDNQVKITEIKDKDGEYNASSYNYNSTTPGASLSADNSVASYSLPYYVFLEKLTSDINEYNINQDVEAYQYSVGTNGHIMTYEIAAPYLSSTQFLDEGYDILGLHQVLNMDTHLNSYTDNLFSKSDIEKMKLSAWYPTTDELAKGNIKKKVDDLYTYARNWVIDNRKVLGKIPDEIFIKTLALQCAIKYNQLFGIPNANGIELIDIDTRDMIRFVVASPEIVYKDYSMSFARFVYESSGGLGVILTAFYILVLWVTSFLKPALMILLLALLVINAVFRKLLFRKESRCIEGFLIGCACLIGCNYLYAIMLKVTLGIATAGFGAFASLIFAILTQVAYVIALIFIMKIELKDWRNNGLGEYINIGASIGHAMTNIHNHFVEWSAQRHNSAFRETSSTRKYKSANYYDLNTVDEMLERDDERINNAMNTA